VCGDGDPQPGALAPLEPARLVGMQHRLLADDARDLCDGPCHGLARGLLQVGDTAQRDRTSKKSSTSSSIPRLLIRYAPLHTDTIAWRRGPNCPAATPGGNVARVEIPHLRQSSACNWYSSTVATTLGTSAT
jgi:hypothetical protein